jgi:hypothetical protein
MFVLPAYFAILFCANPHVCTLQQQISRPLLFEQVTIA